MWEGFGGAIAGAIVGGVVSLLVALLVLKQTRRDNQDLAREEASLEAAKQIGLAVGRLYAATEALQAMTDEQASSCLLDAIDAYEVEELAHLPALRLVALRDAVRQVTAVYRNFRHFAYESGAFKGMSTGLRDTADVQRADFLTGLSEALIAYRQDEAVGLPLQPGWAMRSRTAGWRWSVPPGRWIDGSGSPDAGWSRFVDEEGEFWTFDVDPGRRGEA